MPRSPSAEISIAARSKGRQSLTKARGLLLLAAVHAWIPLVAGAHGLSLRAGSSLASNRRASLRFSSRELGARAAFVEAPVMSVERLWSHLQTLLLRGEQFQEQAPTDVAGLGAIELLKSAPQVACPMCGHLTLHERSGDHHRCCEQCGSLV
jgi:hypothetical protein